MKTDLTKFDKGTIGMSCLNENKDGLSKFGIMINDLVKEVFGDMSGTCPCCGSPLTLDILNVNFKNNDNDAYMPMTKWFSYMAMCSNIACSYQYVGFLKKEFWPESQININKISHTMTFGLTPGILSLPVDDTYILQDILILLKEAGYKKIIFGTRNIFNEVNKFPNKDRGLKIDPDKYTKHCYDLLDGLSSNKMTIIAYKNKGKECKCNNISMLSYIFYNILKISNRAYVDTKIQNRTNFSANAYLSDNIKNKSIFRVIKFNSRNKTSLLQYFNSAIPLYNNSFDDISCLIDSDRIIYDKNHDDSNPKKFGIISKSIESEHIHEKEKPSLELTIKGEDCLGNYDVYCAERYISDTFKFEIPYVFLILAGLDVDLLKQ